MSARDGEAASEPNGNQIMTARITSAETALLMPSPSPRGLKGLLHSLRAAVTAIRMRHETIAQLRALSDRELADIGLSRGGIAGVAAPQAANDQSGVGRAA